MKIEIQTLNGVELPIYQTNGAAAVDLRADVKEGKIKYVLQKSIAPGQTVRFATGVRLNMKTTDMAAMILPRSGLGSKGLILANTVGLIDPDYQGELIIKLKNTSRHGMTVKHGDRIAQMLFVPVIKPEFVQVDEFSTTTERGESGFGSTGVS